ncbi:MAG: hypothetical protein KDK64_03745 [Chlamydiia bacterium]|nr:hypothetical protein [Chlamydiia bacterium]
MTAIVSTLKGFMDVVGKSVGNFAVEMSENAQDDKHNFTAIGLLINNIVSSCTFRPPRTASELREEMIMMGQRNLALEERERIVDLHNPPVADPHSMGEEKLSLVQRAQLWKAAAQELNRHAAGFNPVGGLLVATLIGTTWLGFSNWFSNTFIPYALREHTKFTGKVIVGSSLVMLTKETAEGWSRHSDGTIRLNRARCNERV